MKKIFDLVEKRVILNENILLIPAFKNVYEKYNGDLNVFCFIYYYCDYKSPFADYKPEQKEETLMELYNPDGSFTLEDQEILEAMKQYKDFQWTPAMELLEATKVTFHNMAAYLRTASISDGKDGNISQISNILKQIGPTVSSYDELEKQVAREREKSTVRGGKHVSSRER